MLASRFRKSLIIASMAMTVCLAPTARAQAIRDNQESPKIIRKSGGVLQGSATRRVEPAYPPLAKAARVSGSVVVEVTLDEEGSVISSRAISGHPLLKDSAVSAAKGWKFTPTLLEGTAVKVIGTITFNYNLGDDARDLARIEDLKAQIAANPSSVELRMQLANSYRLDGQTDLAIEEFGNVLQLKPDYAEGYSRLGSTYKEAGQYSRAIEALKRALELSMERADENHMELAWCYLGLNRRDEALESARLALSLKPDFSFADEAHTMIGSILYDQGRYDEALIAFKEAEKLNPGKTQIHFYRGLTYAEMGDMESSQKEYEWLKNKDTSAAEQLLRRINKQQ